MIKYFIEGDDWSPDEAFDTEAAAEAFVRRYRAEIGSYYIVGKDCYQDRYGDWYPVADDEYDPYEDISVDN